MAFGYDLKVVHRTRRPVAMGTAYDHADEFLKCLCDNRLSGSETDRPLIFVAHSLGGIIVKEAIRQSKCLKDNQPNRHLYKIFLSTVGIVFFGTPHRGAEPLDTPRQIAKNAMIAAGYDFNHHIVKDLIPTSDRLKQLQNEFPEIVQKRAISIVSFRETLGMETLGGKKVSQSGF